MKEKHFGVGISTSTLDGLISCLVDDAVQFSFEVLSIVEHFLLLSFAFAVVKGNQPVGIDAGGEVLMYEGPDAPFEALGLECFWWSY